MAEILDILRILGLGEAVRLKQRYDQAQPVVRGYVTTRALWSLLTCGLADRLLEGGRVDAEAFAREHDLDWHVLRSVLVYLDGVLVVRFEDPSAELLPRGRVLLEDTRGLFELIYAYEPLLSNLDDMLAGRARFGRDLDRRIEYVGRGSGRMCRDLPYPVVADIIQRHGRRRVLDLGCGDMALMRFLCDRVPGLTAVGIDIDPEMIAYCRRALEDEPELATRVEAVEGDLRDLAPLRAGGRLDGVDAVTAVDTFHEYLWDGTEPIVAALRHLREQLPEALLVIGELCSQTQEQLRKQPTGFLEHHLCHDLSNQKIGDAALWVRLAGEAGYTVVEQRVFRMIGHGYFVLQP